MASRRRWSACRSSRSTRSSSRSGRTPTPPPNARRSSTSSRAAARETWHSCMWLWASDSRRRSFTSWPRRKSRRETSPSSGRTDRRSGTSRGAPPVPLVDVLLFGHPERGRLLLNIGGIANVTWVPRRGDTSASLAFDTGPGVAVIDAVTRRIDPAAPYDVGGEHARRGQRSARVLDALLADPFFVARPPKSTGREQFGSEYADELRAAVLQAGGSDNDAVATAVALTVETIARGIERWTPAGPSDELVVSGGGARNPILVAQLTARMQPRPVLAFDRLFFDGDAKEALAFAFLGFLTTLGKAGNLPAATGARGPRVLGHVTPA